MSDLDWWEKVGRVLTGYAAVRLWLYNYSHNPDNWDTETFIPISLFLMSLDFHVRPVSLIPIQILITSMLGQFQLLLKISAKSACNFLKTSFGEGNCWPEFLYASSAYLTTLVSSKYSVKKEIF